MGPRLRIGFLTSLGIIGLSAFAGFGAAWAANQNSDELDKLNSLLGGYLAANVARSTNDADRATLYYRGALALDPDNEVLLNQSFAMEASEANWKRAVPLAKDLVRTPGKHRMAHLLLGLNYFKAGSYSRANKEFQAASDGPIGDLTSTLARAWTMVARGDAKGAIKLLDIPGQAEWARFYLNYHKALIADVAGRRTEARASYVRTFGQDNRTLRTALAYARHAARRGDKKLAKSILESQVTRSDGEPHPLAAALLEEIEADKDVDYLVKTADDGMAEVFYGLGEALTGEGGLSMGILYLQYALYIEPNHEFTLAALANAYEASQRFADAIAAYDRIGSDTPLRSSIEIRKAFNLNSLEKADEAKLLLDKLAKDYPEDLAPLDAAGNIMRARKRYGEAVEYYSRALELVPNPDKRHWSLYYSRGTCYERLNDWPPAEADLKKALELYPEQPLALNYLGYSWIDQGHNLEEGMALIERAVALKPDDGYIVDSLGWAHFRLGQFDDAVRYLERAVELKPQDPVLNDHLGDALWRVGREREARFQWEQALTLEPEPEDLDKIKKKLAEGLPSGAGAKIPSVPIKAEGADPKPEAHKETNLAPALE